MDRLRIIETFIAVADAASFGNAANKLGLSKASVSAAISTLERQVGTRLLHRTTRSVALTHDGAAYRDRCLQLLNEYDDMEQLFQNSDVALAGKLRIDMPVRIARNIVIPQLPSLLRQHPKLAIEISATERLVDLVHEGFDCVVRVGPLRDSNLIAKQLGHLRMVNCISPSYAKRHGTPKSPATLQSHFLVGYSHQFAGKPESFEYQHDERIIEIALPTYITVNNADAYEAACLAGLGIIQVPHIGVTDLLAEKKLIAVLPRHNASPMPVHILYSSRRVMSRRLRAVIEWLSSLLAPQLIR
jgi:DNA-binding transcriptional LysR family regulator